MCLMTVKMTISGQTWKGRDEEELCLDGKATGTLNIVTAHEMEMKSHIDKARQQIDDHAATSLAQPSLDSHHEGIP